MHATSADLMRLQPAAELLATLSACIYPGGVPTYVFQVLPQVAGGIAVNGSVHPRPQRVSSRSSGIHLIA
jgi:hypothetical protein